MNEKKSILNKIKTIEKETILEWVVLFFLFWFYVTWARFQPYDGAPDEDMRCAIARYIYEYGKLPHGGDPLLRNANWGISYGFNPILDYMLGGFFMKIMSLVTTKEFALIMSARLPSILSGVGTGYFAIRIGDNLMSKSGKWLFVALVTMLPGAAFVTSYVNCDAMAICSTAMIVYMWIRGMETKWDLKYCIGLGVGISICALSYYNAYGFILCSIFFFQASILICYKDDKWNFKKLLQKGLLVTLVIAALAGWWFVRNYIIYDGDILGMHTSSLYGEKYAIEELKPSNRLTPQRVGLTLSQMVFEGWNITKGSWIELVSHSFIGRFGHFDIDLPDGYITFYLWFLGIGLVAVLIHPLRTFQVRKNKENDPKALFHWVMLIAMCIPSLLSMYYSYVSDYQAQGRYSLPMLIPLMYFVVMGYDNLLTLIIKNQKARQILYAILALVFTGMGLYAYYGVFIPAYYG